MALGLGGLSGTLTAQQLLSQMEILRQQQAQELEQHSQQTAQASQAAGGDYQTAVAAPPEQLNPADQFIPTLLSGVASVLTKDPSFRQRAQENMRARQNELLKARAENLQALRDTALQKAEIAQRAGDLEATGKHRMEMEKLDKASEQVALKQAQDFAAEQNRMDRDSKERQTTAAHEPEGPYDITPLVTTTRSGNRFVDLGGLLGKEKNSAIKEAGKQGLIALSSVDATPLKDVDRARRDVESLWEYVEELLPRDAQGRIAAGPGMKLQKLLQTNDKRAAFKTYRDVAIPVLRALAGSRGLRITQQQIQLSVDNLPKDTDTYETAKRKVGIIYRVLSNAEEPLVNRNWQKQATKNGEDSRVTPAVVRLIGPKNQIREVDPVANPGSVEEAIKRGWKRAK